MLGGHYTNSPWTTCAVSASFTLRSHPSSCKTRLLVGEQWLPALASLTFFPTWLGELLFPISEAWAFTCGLGWVSAQCRQPFLPPRAPAEHMPPDLLKPFCFPHLPGSRLAPLRASRRITVSLKNSKPLKDYCLPPYSGCEMESRLVWFHSGPLSKELEKGIFIYHQEWDDQEAGFTWGFVNNLAMCSKMFPQAVVSRGDVWVKHITCARVQQHLAWSKFILWRWGQRCKR